MSRLWISFGGARSAGSAFTAHYIRHARFRPYKREVHSRLFNGSHGSEATNDTKVSFLDASHLREDDKNFVGVRAVKQKQTAFSQRVQAQGFCSFGTGSGVQNAPLKADPNVVNHGSKLI